MSQVSDKHVLKKGTACGIGEVLVWRMLQHKHGISIQAKNLTFMRLIRSLLDSNVRTLEFKSQQCFLHTKHVGTQQLLKCSKQ